MTLAGKFKDMSPGARKPAPDGSAPGTPVTLAGTPAVSPYGGKRAGTGPGNLAAMNVGMTKLTEEIIELKKQRGEPIRVDIAMCDDGDHHAYPLNPDRVADLVPNIRANGQTSPAQVIALESGRFLIVAGRHRKHALLELGEEQWDVVIKSYSVEDLARVAFYDNLLAPELSEYEKYQGFDKRRKEASLSIEQMAAESGVSKSTIYRYLRFADLPAAAIKIIEKRQKLFPATLADGLAQLAASNPAKVIQACQNVLDEQMTPAQAVAWANAPEAAPTKAEPYRRDFKGAGNKTFARLVARSNILSITIDPAIDVGPFKAELEKLLADHAAATRGS